MRGVISIVDPIIIEDNDLYYSLADSIRTSELVLGLNFLHVFHP